MYGFQVPRDYKEALLLDKQNGNTKWQDCTALEMQQLKDYQTFIDKGLYSQTSIPRGFKKIMMHLVYAANHDGRHKARLVADGHLTNIPLNSVYVGVVSIRGMQLCLFWGSLMEWKHMQPILETPIWRPIRVRKYTLGLDLNLRSWKDTF